MEKTIMATEAVRKFSEILNTIKFKGDHYIIERGGKPVAYMGPVEEAIRIRKLKELKHILKSLPKLGEEIDSFKADLEELIKAQPSLPKEIKWE